MRAICRARGLIRPSWPSQVGYGDLRIKAEEIWPARGVEIRNGGESHRKIGRFYSTMHCWPWSQLPPRVRNSLGTAGGGTDSVTGPTRRVVDIHGPQPTCWLLPGQVVLHVVIRKLHWYAVRGRPDLDGDRAEHHRTALVAKGTVYIFQCVHEPHETERGFSQASSSAGHGSRPTPILNRKSRSLGRRPVYL